MLNNILGFEALFDRSVCLSEVMSVCGLPLLLLVYGPHKVAWDYGQKRLTQAARTALVMESSLFA